MGSQTKNQIPSLTEDLFRGDIREVEFRLDKEGKDFHHFEDFAKMYRAEVGKLELYVLMY